MTNIAIIEDEEEIKDLLNLYLNHLEDYSCKWTAGSVEEFLMYEFTDCKPDVILCDIGLPGISGTKGISLIKEKLPSSAIIMLTSFDDSDIVFEALCAGAAGYLLKKNTPIEKIKDSLDVLKKGGAPMSPEIALKVISFFHQGNKKIKSPLSLREKEIVQGLVDGLSYKMIGEKLEIALDTVRQHIKNIYKKLNVNSKGEVISKSLKGEI